ncbi:hypothetical protein J43TS9_47310 [Paenibacillus cineris]|nr:hypothetical protein J43TS9_47310 [Paenibacillus cineris]
MLPSASHRGKAKLLVKEKVDGGWKCRRTSNRNEESQIRLNYRVPAVTQREAYFLKVKRLSA